MIQYDGDLPDKRNLKLPELFATKEEALKRLEELFLKKRPRAKNWRGPWFEQELPDPEDDRILVWEADLNGAPKMKVVWAFVGDHWFRGDLPGINDCDDVLPSLGKSLYAVCTAGWW
jgi:hypothetical protein